MTKVDNQTLTSPTILDGLEKLDSIGEFAKNIKNNISYFKYKNEGLRIIKEEKLDSFEGNAFEHSYMSAQLTIEYSVNTVDFLGWAQEITLFLVRDVPKFARDENITKLNNQVFESSGDIFNNRVGHEVGKLVNEGKLKREDISEILIGAIKTKQLVVDKQNDNRLSFLSFQDPDFNLTKAINYTQDIENYIRK